MGGVPANIIIPFVGIEFDASRANQGPAEVPITLLVIGQRLAAGAVAEAVKYIAFNADTVATNSGFGSMLHRQALKIFKNNKTVPVWFIGLDDAAGTAATYAFTVGGAATKVGEFVTYIAGQRYAIAVQPADTPTEIATALTVLVTADTNNTQVTIGNLAGLVTVTCKNKGIAAGDLDVRFNYNTGEELPAGITVTAITPTAGTVDPDIADALAVIGADWFNVIAQPYTDATNMGLLQDHLADVAGPMEQRDGVSYQTVRDTLSNMITYGLDVANHNSQWTATNAAYKRMESTYEVAAGIAAITAVSIQELASVPLHRLKLTGFSVLDSNDKWTSTERNQLAKSGIGTLTDDNGVQTEGTVTMYLKNSANAADTAYQQQNTVFTLSALRYLFVNRILTKYPRALLGDAADNLEPGIQIMTPKLGRLEAIAWFKQMQRKGLVDASDAAADQFKEELRVTRDGTNVNRLNWLLPPDLMNQFIVGSGVMQFIA